jgi:hypothetical protein
MSDDLHVAIRLATMIYKPSGVTSDCSITHPKIINLEAPDVASAKVAILSNSTLFVCDFLTVIVNDSFILVNGSSGEHSPTVNL